MKKMLFIWCLFFSYRAMAQETKVTDHYTISGGLLGAVNFSKFRNSGEYVSNIFSKSNAGWSGGAWFNFPLDNNISFEPQLLYSSYGYKSYTSTTNYFKGTGSYFSVPLLFKLRVGPVFAFTAGPQFDFLTYIKDDKSRLHKNDFKKTSIALTAGGEVFPVGTLSIFARYIHGVSNMGIEGNANTSSKFYNQAIQLGVKVKLFGKHIVPPPDTDGDGIADPADKCPTQAGLARYQGCPIPDSDADGINDENDKCPNQAGVAQYDGCPVPDSDGDGINDENDKCPAKPGTARYNGCPVPDTDTDGINDEEDKCPTQAGLARYQGCPIPDTDGDGINDEEDRCPTVAGVAANKGCPAIENFQASEVTFGKGKAVLTASGKRELDLAVAYMTKYPDVKIRLDGYTDNSGSDKTNQPLSVKRAEAAMQYIVSRGIDDSRISAEGHGAANPIADNKQAEGRAQNRRVEITVL